MTTFSQLVDELATELVRPDLKTTIAAYVNQTLRELHFRPGQQAPALFGNNREEDSVTITDDGVYLWPLPKPARFQQLESAYCPEVGQYWKQRAPSVVYKEGEVTSRIFTEMYWYRTGSYIAFNGMKTGHTLLLTWFEYCPLFKYQAVADRTVIYDIDTDSYTGTESEQALATHWVLQRWGEEVKEGARSKVWKRLGDAERARMSYSSFESARSMIQNAEEK